MEHVLLFHNVSKEVVLVFASGVLRSFRNCCHILITACNIADGHLTDATSFPAILLMRDGHYTVFHRHERCKSYTWKQVLVVWHILTNARELLQNLGRSSPHGSQVVPNIYTHIYIMMSIASTTCFGTFDMKASRRDPNSGTSKV